MTTLRKDFIDSWIDFYHHYQSIDLLTNIDSYWAIITQVN
ncbi:hypothetical protein A1OE_1266 [Candidatus Endolissoclinum faulkneri L2]|uniref:Uncharacterized protein n=1 Tax=Candidatus Endolissoclinum faulkneri L2 TaxID=1193729 RepID=K7YIL9_9PROT|nr:hypothetical protein A1OE_1266 [Candidatus Endolissoclinum faulkneri L2]